jgi:ParB-like chromosome segregation protein Spo0J
MTRRPGWSSKWPRPILIGEDGEPIARTERPLTATETLSVHPAAEIFPLLEGVELQGLVDDIKANGLRHPIIVYDVWGQLGDDPPLWVAHQILDGRNRLRACELAGVEPRFQAYIGDDPVAYVLSANLHHRHLDASQRAMIAAKALPMFEAEAKARIVEGARAGGAGKGSANLREGSAGKATEHAAKLVSVAPRSVEHAKVVVERGIPELVAAVEHAQVAVSTASEIARLPAAEQPVAYAKVIYGAKKRPGKKNLEATRKAAKNWSVPRSIPAAAAFFCERLTSTERNKLARLIGAPLVNQLAINTIITSIAGLEPGELARVREAVDRALATCEASA